MLFATLKIWGLQPGERYAVLRFDDATKLPTKGFLSKRASAAEVWEFTAAPGVSQTSFDVSFPSDSTQFYRIVRTRSADSYGRSRTEAQTQQGWWYQGLL